MDIWRGALWIPAGEVVSGMNRYEIYRCGHGDYLRCGVFVIIRGRKMRKNFSVDINSTEVVVSKNTQQRLFNCSTRKTKLSVSSVEQMFSQ